MSEVWQANFFILHDVRFLVMLQAGKSLVGVLCALCHAHPAFSCYSDSLHRPLAPRILARMVRLASLCTTTTPSSANVLQATKAKSAIEVTLNTALPNSLYTFIIVAHVVLAFGVSKVLDKLVQDGLRDHHSNQPSGRANFRGGAYTSYSTQVDEKFANNPEMHTNERHRLRNKWRISKAPLPPGSSNDKRNKKFFLNTCNARFPLRAFRGRLPRAV